MELHTWLSTTFPSTNTEVQPPIELKPHTWTEIRLFISSTFIDTNGERDALVKRVIPSINRKLVSRYIRVIPVDLRLGVLSEESNTCQAIQTTCLNIVDKCRQEVGESPWFLGLRTARYGWIQNEVVSSKELETPKECDWLDKFDEYNKHVSITSLESIHAALPPKTRTNAPTVFFYKRHITNWNEIEDNLRWLFDFEYVPQITKLDAQVQYQYSKTEDAIAYKNDKDNLDKYLMGLDHVTYRTYECLYEEGGDTRFTCKKENQKSSGVGYVSALSEFEKQVEEDLLKSIYENFKEADASHIPEHVVHNLPHENAVKQKASTYVGRSELYEQCYQHCTSKEVGNSVMIIHGEPGCGKSALLAAVSKKCLNELRTQGDFLFVHAVDSCPGSTNIESMLLRLQTNIRRYRIDMGESDISEAFPNTASDLKIRHVKFLEESARRYPEKKFVIVIDAVNQFHEHLQSWKMWWLPSETAPNNLRIVVSTLNDENCTFRNACGACPKAVKVPVPDMSREDCEELVAACFARYHKKLTTNQVDDLLAKSTSPLYLFAASEALRKFGVFREAKAYITSFPDSISELFSFLLDEWSKEYSFKLTKDVSSLLCLSKDGLLETQINDILLYKESHGELYGSSFSRLYDSISSFLAAGGGGYLRFFHDQLRKVVRDKFLTSSTFEREIHGWLADFYLFTIGPQLCEVPSEFPPAYYEHCLQQVVYHQLESTKMSEEKEDFTRTLKNIYFVRERVNHQQEDQLQHAYLTAVKRTKDDNEKETLTQWAKFTRLYSPYIKQFPEWAYNMAMNQHPTSHVYMDTTKLPEGTQHESYPLYRSNIPTTEDAVAFKYSGKMCFSCVASASEKNLICVGGDDEAFLYEADSGIVIHKVELEGAVASVYLSAQCNSFWTGNTEGYVSIWNNDTGGEEWRSDRIGKGYVLWMESVDRHAVGCGTGGLALESEQIVHVGTISIIDEEKNNVIRSWSTDEPSCFSYCFHRNEKMILSGHEGVIKSWTLNGCLVKSVQFDSIPDVPVNYADSKVKVACISIHPTKDIVTCAMYVDDDYLSVYFLNKILNFSTGTDVKIRNFTTGEYIRPGSFGKVSYDTTGDRICVSQDGKTVMVYDEEGNLLNKLKGHSAHLCDMCVVPGTNDLLTAAHDGSILFHIPTTPDHAVGEEAEVIICCEFLPGNEEFVTLDVGGNLQVWKTSSCERKQSIHVEGDYSRGSYSRPDGFLCVHPSGNYVVVCSLRGNKLFWFNTANLQELPICYPLHEGEDIQDVKVSRDGMKCVVAADDKGAIVLDITNINEIKRGVTCDGIRTCDIHRDNEQMVSGGDWEVEVWNLLTGEKIRTLCETNGRIYYTTFVYDPERVIYVDRWPKVHMVDMSGGKLMTFDGKLKHIQSLTVQPNGQQLITADKDNTIRFHDLHTGKVSYIFVDHRSEGFRCLAVHPSDNTVIASNENGMMYVLKNPRFGNVPVSVMSLCIFGNPGMVRFHFTATALLRRDFSHISFPQYTYV